MIALLFGETIDTWSGKGPLTLTTNEITGNGCGAFVAGHAVVFRVRNDVAGINAVF